jgi:hypothetical protein
MIAYAIASVLWFSPSPAEEAQSELIFSRESLEPFDELMISWNMDRPVEGDVSFFVSLRQKNWSPWLPYAVWGADGQKSFEKKKGGVAVYQDAVVPEEGRATGFRIQCVAPRGSTLKGLRAIAASVSRHALSALPPPLDELPPVCLPAIGPGRSQMALDHVRRRDLCSPTSTVNAVEILVGRPVADPAIWASQVWDKGWDIYGNWVFNTAAAYALLGGNYLCHVERLSGFTALHAQLAAGRPVVVSLKGELPGAPLPYRRGHLVCIVGYDEKGGVLCIDPAFPSDAETLVRYPLADFLRCWGERRYLAYLFTPTSEIIGLSQYTERDSKVNFGPAPKPRAQN